MSEPVTMRWHDDELLPDDMRNALCGPGAPFEIVEEDVLGERLPVFAQRPRSLREMLLNAAERHASSPYLVFWDDSVTYGELPRRVASYAAVLAEQFEVGKGDRVAIASANTIDYALTIWACIAMGAIVTGLNGWWTGPELAYGVELTQPKVLIGDQPRLERIAASGAHVDAPIVRWEELKTLVSARGEAAFPDTPLDEDDPFVILFTSGTTGRPKGATLSHRNMIHFALSSGLRGATSALLANTRATGGTATTASPMAAASLCAGPFFHISGIAPIMMGGPFYGTAIVFTPPGRWDETTHLELTEKHRIATWSGVPTMYWRLLEHPDFDTYDLTSVRAISSGGAPFPPELIRLLHEKFPGAGVTQGYGASETMGAGTLSFGPLMEHHPDAVGRATPAIDIQIRDDDGNVLGEGEVGEICMRASVVFLGYWDNPEATAQAFWPGRWYRTGDFGRIDDGVLFIESRMRDLILRGGENIYPIEIEHRLVEHPDIVDAAVIGVAHRGLGQEVKAFVVPTEGAELSASDVQRWAAETLAAYKVPAYVEFRDTLPYTETGKVMKTALESEEAAPASG
jgi:acyl-CoA synthetase (AMP-forming)/AMP-acid ligase II